MYIDIYIYIRNHHQFFHILVRKYEVVELSTSRLAMNWSSCRPRKAEGATDSYQGTIRYGQKWEEGFNRQKKYVFLSNIIRTCSSNFFKMFVFLLDTTFVDSLLNLLFHGVKIGMRSTRVGMLILRDIRNKDRDITRHEVGTAAQPANDQSSVPVLVSSHVCDKDHWGMADHLFLSSCFARDQGHVSQSADGRQEV